MKPDIVIATPVRDRAWILPTWGRFMRRAIAEGKKDGLEIACVFVENDSVDETPDILEQWRRDDPDSVTVLKHDFGRHHYRDPENERRVIEPSMKRELAILRNDLVEAFLKTEAQCLLMWDSDLIIPCWTFLGYQSLPRVIEDNSRLDAVCVDVQHPYCRGRFHNYLLEVGSGRYNHPDRTAHVPSDRYLSALTPSGIPGLPQSAVQMWEQATRFHELLRVDTLGGGGAALFRRRVFAPTPEGYDARFGAHEQGEDVPLCQCIRARDGIIAVYAGVRVLHCTRDLLAMVGRLEEGMVPPRGVWVEDFLRWWRQGHGGQATPIEAGE